MAQSESARVAEMQRLSDERRASIIEAVALVWQHGPEASAKAALAAVVLALRGEADYLTANKVKGHVTQAQTIRAGAARVAAYEMKMSDASTVRGEPVPMPTDMHLLDLNSQLQSETAGQPVLFTNPPDMAEMGARAAGFASLADAKAQLEPLDSSQAARCADGVHPEISLSTRKDGSTFCTACQQQLSPPVGATVNVGGIDFTKIGVDPFGTRDPWLPNTPPPGVVFQSPGSVADTAAAGDALSYISGQSDTYQPQGATMAAAPTPTPDPFSNPTGAPNNRPDSRKVMPYMEVRGLLLQLEPSGSQSVSAIEARGGCGMKLGFDRLSRRGLVAQPRPQWSLIGGKAFHTLTELMERWVWGQNRANPGSASLAVFNPSIVPQHWTTALNQARDAALEGTPYTIEDIRPSNRGLEGYDWWRVEGVEMVNRYVATHTSADYVSKFRLASFDNGASPALEVEYRVNTNPLAGTMLPGGAPVGSGIELHGFIDRIDVAVDSSCYVIRDLKSGRSKGSQFQGANYIHAARRTLAIPAETPILFSNFDARTGGYTDPRQLDLVITWDEIVARAEEAETANAARIYPASPSSFCGGCGHNAICPGKVA